MRRLIALGIDLVLVSAATLLAFAIRDNFDISPHRFTVMAPHLAITVVAAMIVLPVMGLHRSMWRFSSMSDYLYVLAASVVIVLAAVILSFLIYRLDGIARSVPLLQSILILLFLVGGRVFMRLRHANRRKPVSQFSAVETTTLKPSSVLIVGLNRLTELYLQAAQEMSTGRTHVAGLLGQGERQTGRLMHRYPVLGTPEQLNDILKDLEIHGVFIDRIVIAVKWTNLSANAQAALRLVEGTSNVQLTLLAESLGFADSGSAMTMASSSIPDFDPPNSGLALMDIGNAKESDRSDTALKVDANECDELKKNRYWTLKRGLDILGALGLIFLLTPIMLLVTFLALVDVGRPVFFWQQRPGLGGRPFRLRKIRTMKAAHDESGRLLTDSQRLSAVGRALRATRLDELPQLFQILAGQMSFVGPRPLLPVDQPVGFAARLLVRPGLTGWAQVKGGRHLSAIDKAALDVWYVRNAGFWLDAEILLRTAGILLFGEKTNAEAIRKAWEASAASTSNANDKHGEDARALAKHRTLGRRLA